MKKFRHIIEAQQFGQDHIKEIFELAKQMETILEKGITPPNLRLEDKIMASLFYEESTRTRWSFETAMHRLGGKVISTENARKFSSVAKGETLEHTIEVISGRGYYHCRYADVIVLRRYEIGAAKRAAQVSAVPVINAGDGPGQHPSQALLDLYTIKKELGKIEGISIAMVGDLANGRTVRSLSYLLCEYKDVKIYFVAPKILEINQDIKNYLTKQGVYFEEISDLREIASQLNFIYITRVQKNRFSDAKQMEAYENNKEKYIVDKEILGLTEEKGALIGHPMPIDKEEQEIRPEIENHPRIIFLRQAGNGVPIRMALLSLIDWNFSQKEDQ